MVITGLKYLNSKVGYCKSIIYILSYLSWSTIQSFLNIYLIGRKYLALD